VGTSKETGEEKAENALKEYSDVLGSSLDSVESVKSEGAARGGEDP